MDVQQLSDRAEITDVITKMAWYQDRRDWDAIARKVLAEELTVDYPAEHGGHRETVTAHHQVTSWRTALEAVDASQHVLTDILITCDGDHADATANELGRMHRAASRGSPWWAFGGTLRMALTRTPAGWRISALSARPTWVDGNAAILDPA